MLTSPHHSNSVTRANLFKFLAIVCDIQEGRESLNCSYFEEEISGLALDDDWKDEPLIVIKIGDFDELGRWSCTEP